MISHTPINPKPTASGIKFLPEVFRPFVVKADGIGFIINTNVTPENPCRDDFITVGFIGNVHHELNGATVRSWLRRLGR